MREIRLARQKLIDSGMDPGEAFGVTAIPDMGSDAVDATGVADAADAAGTADAVERMPYGEMRDSRSPKDLGDLENPGVPGDSRDSRDLGDLRYGEPHRTPASTQSDALALAELAPGGRSDQWQSPGPRESLYGSAAAQQLLLSQGNDERLQKIQGLQARADVAPLTQASLGQASLPQASPPQTSLSRSAAAAAQDDIASREKGILYEIAMGYKARCAKLQDELREAKTTQARLEDEIAALNTTIRDAERESQKERRAAQERERRASSGQQEAIVEIATLRQQLREQVERTSELSRELVKKAAMLESKEEIIRQLKEQSEATSTHASLLSTRLGESLENGARLEDEMLRRIERLELTIREYEIREADWQREKDELQAAARKADALRISKEKAKADLELAVLDRRAAEDRVSVLEAREKQLENEVATLRELGARRGSWGTSSRGMEDLPEKEAPVVEAQ